MLSEELKNKIDKEVQKFIDINNMPLGDYYLVNQVKDMVVDIIENSNIVELPCKVGDKVYIIRTDCFHCKYYERLCYKSGKHKGLWNGKEYCKKLEEEIYGSMCYDVEFDCTGGKYEILESNFELHDYFCNAFTNNHYIDRYNKTWFTDKAKAEERLKELNNGKLIIKKN